MLLKMKYLQDYLKFTQKDNKILVELTGTVIVPKHIYIPESIENWLTSLDKAKTDIFTNWDGKKTYTIHVYTKATLNPKDIKDDVLGKRIAESKAKMRMNSYMWTFCLKLINYYNALCGIEQQGFTYNVKNDTLAGDAKRYFILYSNEGRHLVELLKQVKTCTK